MTAERSPLVYGVRLVKREGCDLHIELGTVHREHLVGASHDAGRGGQFTPRGVLERLAGSEHRLLAHHTFTLDFPNVTGLVGNYPVAAEKLDGLVAFVR